MHLVVVIIYPNKIITMYVQVGAHKGRESIRQGNGVHDREHGRNFPRYATSNLETNKGDLVANENETGNNGRHQPIWLSNIV